jgi:hypothetical protein
MTSLQDPSVVELNKENSVPAKSPYDLSDPARLDGGGPNFPLASWFAIPVWFLTGCLARDESTGGGGGGCGGFRPPPLLTLSVGLFPVNFSSVT